MEACICVRVNNNPVMFVDPTGESGIKISVWHNIGVGNGEGKGHLSDGIGGGIYVGIEPGTSGRAGNRGFCGKDETRIDGVNAGAGFEIGYYKGDSKDYFQGKPSFERLVIGPLSAMVTFFGQRQKSKLMDNIL